MSAKATVNSLDKQKISAIFLGKTFTFPDGIPVEPIEQVDDSAAHEEFHQLVTEKTGSQLKAYWSKMVFSGLSNPPREVASTHLLKYLR